MPIDNYNWTNCRKCGHRYARHISRCPRCSAKTKLISGKIIAAISIGVAAIAVFYVLSSGTFAVQAVQDNLKNTVTEVSSSLPSTVPREPIAIYEYCYSAINGNSGSRSSIHTTCYEERFSPLMREIDNKQLADFTFTLPPQLEAIVTIRTESVVYQYAENDFELGLFDQVGEKRYQVRLLEFPT